MAQIQQTIKDIRNFYNNFGDLNKNQKTSQQGLVYRLERLLGGESFEQMSEIVKNSYEKIEKFYQEVHDEYVNELNSLPKDNSDIKEYKELLKLAKMPAEDLLEEEQYRLFLEYRKFCLNMSELNFVLNHETSDDSPFSEPQSFNDFHNNVDRLKFLQAIATATAEEPRSLYLKKLIAGCEKEIEDNKKRQKVIYLSINRDVLFEQFDRVLNLLSGKDFQNKQVELVVDGDCGQTNKKASKSRVPYNFSKDECEKLCELVTFVDRLSFSEFQMQNISPINHNLLWDFSEVINANLEYERDINQIKNLNLSPFEYVLCAHNIFTQSEYKSANGEDSRTFLTVVDNETEGLKNKGLVCSGFASAGKVIIDIINKPNLKCEYLNIDFYDKKTKLQDGSHTLLLVYLNDKKYGINGYYIWDPTWDSGRNRLTHCLFPVSDLAHYVDDIAYNSFALQDSVAHCVLYSSGIPRKINDANLKNNVLDKYGDKSSPIPLSIYHDALVELYTSYASNSYNGWEEVDINFIKNRANEIITATINGLTSFDPENANSGFYSYVREFFKSKPEEYKDWQRNWKEYIQNLCYVEKGK